MTLPLVPLHAAGDKARQGMRHLLFPTLATSDCRSRLQEASHLGSGVQILGPEFRQCVYVCKRVSSVQFDAHVSACCSICTVGSGYDASCLARRHMRSFLTAGFQTSAPACLTPASCTVTSQLHYLATSGDLPQL